MKRCPRCAQTKPLDDFYRSSKSRDGHQGYCKTCVRDNLRERAASRPRKHRLRIPAPDGFKWCADCGETKPVSEFPKKAAVGYLEFHDVVTSSPFAPQMFEPVAAIYIDYVGHRAA